MSLMLSEADPQPCPYAEEHAGDLPDWIHRFWFCWMYWHMTLHICIFTLGNGPISWSLKWQTLVTTSTCEAEYVVSCHAMKEAIWLQCLLKILSHRQSTMTIHSDNAGSIALMKNATFHTCSKHIDVQFHYTWEWVDEKDVTFRYLPMNDMPTDIMMKALPHVKHKKFTMLLSLCPI